MAKKRDLDYTQIQVTVFDPASPGEAGATAAAAGLLHPFTPRVKKKCWHSKKAVPAAEHLIEQAQAHADGPLLVRSGILRLALDKRALEDYAIAARRYPQEVKFWDAAAVAANCPTATHVPAAFLPQGAVVHVANYTRALAAACDASGRVEWRRTAVSDVRPLLGIHDDDGGANASDDKSEFDAVVVANGAAVRALQGLANVPVTPCRGQNVRYAATSDLTIAPPFPIISGKYFVPDLFSPEGAAPAMIGGATFEYCGKGEIESEFVTSNASVTDVEHAHGELSDPLSRLVPSLSHFWHPSDSVAGMRALPPRSTLGSVPLAARLEGAPWNKSLWVLNGLGSRGLLHHAYLGKLLAQAVVAGNEKLIPIDARRVAMSLENYGLRVH